MNNKSFILWMFLAAALLVTSCSDETDNETNRMVCITVNMPKEYASTRVGLDLVEGEKTLVASFLFDDKFSVYVRQGDMIKEVESTFSANFFERKEGTLKFALPAFVKENEEYTIYGICGASSRIKDGRLVVDDNSKIEPINEFTAPIWFKYTGKKVPSILPCEYIGTYIVLHVTNQSDTESLFQIYGLISDALYDDLYWDENTKTFSEDFGVSPSSKAVPLKPREEGVFIYNGISNGKSMETLDVSMHIGPEITWGMDMVKPESPKTVGKTLEEGRAYHVYLTWNGKDLKFGKDEGMTIYPTSSYKLSEDGKTLERWYGQEKTIDMTADPAFDNVETIDFKAFEYGLAENIILSNKVTTIKKWAFDEASVKNIWLPKSLTSIGDDAFDDCIYLEEVHITDLSAWCRINFALGIGSTIRSYSNSNPLKYAKSLYLNGEKITDLVIPDDVEKINAEAFSYADFKSVYISDNVKEIGDYAFHACDKLATIHFGVNLMYLGNYTFSWCTTLTEIIFPESLQTAGEGAFQYCDNIERIYIGENFSHYHWRDSFGCKNLKEFIVSPKNNYFFAYDGALYCYTESYSEEAKKYVLDGGVELHHYPCGRKNASFTIPNFVTKLYEAFSHCYNLQSVTILEGITDAGCLTMLFNQSQVPNLEKVVVYAKTPPHTYYNGYGNIGSNVKLYVPAESMEEYKNAEGWNKFSIILPIDEGGAL